MPEGNCWFEADATPGAGGDQFRSLPGFHPARILNALHTPPMFRRRELFILAGVVAIEPDPAPPVSLDVAMEQIEHAARSSVRQADRQLIDATVMPTDGRTAVMLDIRFTGDQAGALAAFERRKDAVAEVPTVRRLLRTLLRGRDGLNLEWIDDEYQAGLQARWDADQQKP